uniref:Uncharacterized protein n=1 Tax=Mus musculus TaxID=10090 RepID=Q9DA76_MOUSE|nr:unnamed protein product [Mus musculus]
MAQMEERVVRGLTGSPRAEKAGGGSGKPASGAAPQLRPVRGGRKSGKQGRGPGTLSPAPRPRPPGPRAVPASPGPAPSGRRPPGVGWHSRAPSSRLRLFAPPRHHHPRPCLRGVRAPRPASRLRSRERAPCASASRLALLQARGPSGSRDSGLGP